jgi:hypothetical protein
MGGGFGLVVFLGIDVRTGSVLSRTSWRVCKWSTRPTSSWMIQRKHATAVVGSHRSTKPASEQIFRIWQLELRNATHLDIYLLALGRKGDGNVRHAPHTTYGLLRILQGSCTAPYSTSRQCAMRLLHITRRLCTLPSGSLDSSQAVLWPPRSSERRSSLSTILSQGTAALATACMVAL